MNFKERLNEIIENINAEYFTAKQLYGILQTKSTAERMAVKEALSELANDCKLVYDRRNDRYRKLRGETGKAIFQANARGFGFLLRDDGEDLFVPASKTNGAFHRDEVLYRRLPGTKDEAEIVRILQRGSSHIVGTYEKGHNARFVIPDDRRFISDIYVLPKKDFGAKNGQKVVARVTHYPDDNRNCPEGEIEEVLGFPDDRDVDMLSVAASYGLHEGFPDNVQRRAQAVSQQPSEADLQGRTDLRGEIIFTIDGEDAKDLDDAVSVVENPDGTFSLGVHIADVSHYVVSGGDIDKEAFERGTSVYFPDRVFPMLPRELSNGICSLYEGVDRLTVSCMMQVDGRGKVTDYSVFPSVINSRHRMTYTAVQAILDGDKAAQDQYADIADSLFAMEKLAHILQDARVRRGNIEFASREVEFVYDERGETVDVRLADNGFSHRIIEEFMIAANECVARYAENCELPFVYRVHAKPDESKLNVLFALMSGLGINVRRTREMHNSVLQAALLAAERTPYFNLVNDVMLRTMQKAKYSDVNTGHFGLASRCYCHFTSPIRRYADLTVHRVLKTALAGKMTEKAANFYDERCCEAARRASEREKIADEAERKAQDVKKCAYAARMIGREFDALVSGVTERGIFAELPNTVEGFISIEQLGDDLVYDPDRFCLCNQASRYSLGDEIKIAIASVDKQACRIDFSLVSRSSSAKDSRK